MKKFLSIFALVIGVTVLLSSSSSVLAYRGDTSVKGPNYTPERHEAMTKAFEQKDFTAWKNLMQGRGRITQVINEQNFSRFAEMHKSQLEGKTTEANLIRAELGLGQGNRSGRGVGCGMGQNINK